MPRVKACFHATLKPPDDPTPSGDRTIARLLLAALARAGIETTVPSGMSTRARSPDTEVRQRLRETALAEAQRIIRELGATGVGRPDVWVTYHLYYKAPDWIGATVARALAIPYVVAEASHAGKRDRDDWALWQRDALVHLRQADRVLCLTETDRRGITPFVEADRLVDLPPFLDTAPFADLATDRSLKSNDGPVRLITVAMMRHGVKLESYRHLAAALAKAPARAWHLTIVGDGDARPDVEAAFSDLPTGQLTWRGLADPDGVRSALSESDLHIWPGLKEAFGMAYLEAAAAGVPSVAYQSGGVAAVVRDGETGLLAEEGDTTALAAAATALISSSELRQRMAAAAHAFAHRERSIEHAAAILADTLMPLTHRTRP